MPNTKAVYSTEMGENRVQIGKNPFFWFRQGWAYQPGGIFKEVFDEKILLLISFGFPQKWEEMAILELKKYSRPETEIIKYHPKSMQLNLENMQVIK